MKSVVVFALYALLSLLAPDASATRRLSGVTESGAHYNIAAPDNWRNGDSLVLFQHGLSFDTVDEDPDLGPLLDLQLSEGYAVAASGFSQRSWALFRAPDDNAQLLTLFRQQVGAPGAIIPFGGSLGGLLALKLAEDTRFAPVSGVYSLCPPVAGSRVWDAGFDLRLAYDAVCHGAGELPNGNDPFPWAFNLFDIPSDLGDLLDRAKVLRTLIAVNQCTGIDLPPGLRNGAMQRRLNTLMALAHTTTENFFVTLLGYSTFALSDLVRAFDKLAGRNPFTSIGVGYGSELDPDIARIAADPLAALAFRWASDFRGHIGSAKVISLTTSGDQLVIPANQYILRKLLPSNQLTSAIVREDAPTHCGFTRAEGVAGWEGLRGWIANGPQPTAANLQTLCGSAVAAGIAGPCRIDPELTPPPFDSIVAPRPALTLAALDARFSGMWYDPQRNGEGITVEMIDDKSALVYFFTYAPSGFNQQQAWMIGVGDIVGNGFVVEPTSNYIPLPNSNGQQIQRWGRLEIVFEDCGHGRMRWSGGPQWGTREVNLTRLTALQGGSCDAAPTATLPQQVSGSWYDPANSGSGFHLEQIDTSHVLALYFFGGSSGRWWIGVGEGNPATGISIPLNVTSGPRFGSAYNPGALTTPSVGQVQLTLGCSSGTARFISPPAGSGIPSTSITLSRLTRPQGIPGC